MSGIELLKKIQEINQDVKLILMSAFEINTDSDLKELGLSDFLQKPIHMDKLIDVVKNCESYSVTT